MTSPTQLDNVRWQFVDDQFPKFFNFYLIDFL